ncbi:conserved hypothetical protein [Ricinus communis]|uniref:DUF4283 domain-containing protein n=1 Tax=Ricinus communis TaxID=3988 RepID=B9RX91_RICCO|nr:conserved hypothetical protein [Ricinus communis]
MNSDPSSLEAALKEPPLPSAPSEGRLVKKVKVQFEGHMALHDVEVGITFKDKLMAESMQIEQVMEEALILKYWTMIFLPDAVIIRLLSRTISYKALSTKIEDLWQPRNGYKIVELENEYFTTLLKGP